MESKQQKRRTGDSFSPSSPAKAADAAPSSPPPAWQCCGSDTPLPPLWAGSGANAPPGRIYCINSGPGIPAERGFTERGLCEAVWTEEGLRDAFCCSRQPRCGYFFGCGGRGVWSVSVMSGTTDVLMFYQRWERTECTSTESRTPHNTQLTATPLSPSQSQLNSAGCK